MMSKEIDPNILRQNIKYLEYKPIVEFDEHESITPTTNKGHLTQESKKYFFEDVSKKLQELKEQNEKTEFYTEVQGSFKNQEALGRFIKSQGETLKNFTSDKIFVKKYQHEDSDISSVFRFGINVYFDNLKQEIDNYNRSFNLKPLSSKGSAKVRQEEYSKFAKQIALTNIEQLVIKNVIGYLISDKDIKTILLDVFERNSEGKVVIKKDDIIDTHTIVMYKDINNGVIFIIDPSNPQFSNCLANFKDSPLEIQAGYIDKKVYKVPEKGGVYPIKMKMPKISFLKAIFTSKYKSIFI